MKDELDELRTFENGDIFAAVIELGHGLYHVALAETKMKQVARALFMGVRQSKSAILAAAREYLEARGTQT